MVVSPYRAIEHNGHRPPWALLYNESPPLLPVSPNRQSTPRFHITISRAGEWENRGWPDIAAAYDRANPDNS